MLKAATPKLAALHLPAGMRMELGGEKEGSAEVQGLSDDNIKTVIADGKGKMKPIKTVTGKAADDVVAYVRTFKK